MSKRTRVFHRSLTAALLLALTPAAYAFAQSATLQSADRPAAPRCTAAGATGTYRMTLERERAEPRFALLVLEREAGCFSALLLIDQTQTVIQSLTLGDSTLAGTIHTDRGLATVTLRFTPDGVTGTVQQGKKRWAVRGERTS